MTENNKQAEYAFNMSLRYLSHRARSILEMKTYLSKKGIENSVIDDVIARLADRKYLDDKAFAEMFVSGRAANNPKSRFALTYELKKKGINPELIDIVLNDYDDYPLALTSVKKKFNLWFSLDDKTFRKKVMNHLRYRGFSYDICTRALQHYLNKKQERSRLEEKM